MRMRFTRKRRILISVASLVVWIFGAAAGRVAAQGNDQAQVDKGRQAVGQVCVACHSNIMRMIQLHKKSADQWRDTVFSMIGRGALILPDEIDPLAAFLAANAGPNSRAAAAPVRTAAQTADSEGRAILERNCQQCHDLETATKKPEAQDWAAEIGKMVTYGAKLTTAEQQKLVEHLNGLAK